MATDEASAEAPERILRRIELVAAGYGLAGASLLLAWRSPGSAIALTLGAAVSIVAFRGLRALVERLGPDSERRIDRRSRRLVWLRFSLLLLLPLASLWVSSEQALVLLMGFSALPLAIVTEALLQLFSGVGTERDDGRTRRCS